MQVSMNATERRHISHNQKGNISALGLPLWAIMRKQAKIRTYIGPNCIWQDPSTNPLLGLAS